MKFFGREKEKKDLKEEKGQIEKELEELPLRKKPLQEEKDELLEGVKQVKNELQPILEEEKKADEKKEEVERRERLAVSLEKKRGIEKERWQVEEERRAIEARKWKIEEKIEELENTIEKIDDNSQKLLDEENKLRARINEISEREKEIALEEEREKIKEELNMILQEKEPLGRQSEELAEKKKGNERELSLILGDEKTVEEEIKITEEKEKLISSLKEQKEIEKKRWEAEEERRKLEQERWSWEEEKSKLDLQIRELTLNYQKLVRREERLRMRLKEIEGLLGRKEETEEIREREYPKREVQFAPEPEDDVIRKARERLERLAEERGREEEKLRDRLEFGRKEEKVEKSEPIEEREEVYERIRPPQTFKKKGGDPGVEIPRPTTRSEENIYPASFKRPPGLLKKFLTRVIVLIILLLIIGIITAFFYWYFKQRTKVSNFLLPPEEKTSQPLPLAPEEIQPTQPQEISIPPSLISVNETKELEISKNDDIPSSFTSVIKEDLKIGQFTRILFKNSKESKIAGLSDFFSSLKVNSPENFYQKLGNETLFIWTQKEGKRFGFIVEVKNGSEELKDILKSWEPSMEKDFEEIFKILGKTGKPYSPVFKDFSYKGINFRCQTFSKNDLGICYFVSKERLIWTSSFESMIEIFK